ncbi:hypothetical protein L198_06006 [Cryptococcus wingfieldii CBS 7118]|uniref:Uncharacterized protein n=1 Tax=Cryptococcus wingfieldii CBS 7118 TaxID=1295528 RepID=A0A1E3IUB0_9TREE|nr:hypothetical protein L198_06006 [Cryptococcus wingfieldii CBS 7118]ODN91486.1 hypothetical protein L198_06006 [Cryptococcus wingfieldii CBS 7118]
MPPNETKPGEPAPVAPMPITSKSLSVFFDEHSKPLNSEEASGRPIFCIAKEGKIILGPRPPVVDLPTPLCTDDNT